MLLFIRPTRDELRRPLPGDALVPNAVATVMHAATIRAPLECVWPWLVQMGAGRAGWYSYDWVDNGGRPSASEIIPELQHLAPGDVMPSLPGAQDNFMVATVEQRRDLTLTVPAADGGNLVSWEFFLEPHPSGTRLLVRGRVGPKWPAGGSGKPAASRRLIERIYAVLARMPRWMMVPIATIGHAVMQRRQLMGIKRRAEALARKA